MDSAQDIEQNGLNRTNWEAIIQQHGGDTKGFSVTVDPKVAEDWAATQAAMRGKPLGIVLNGGVGPTAQPLHGSFAWRPERIFHRAGRFFASWPRSFQAVWRAGSSPRQANHIAKPVTGATDFLLRRFGEKR